MRPIDHFRAGLDRLEASLGPGEKLDKKTEEKLAADFVSLAGSVIGREAAGDLFSRSRKRGRSLESIGALAAFFLGEYDDTKALDAGDWEDLRETLEEAAGDMDMNTLTALMGELLSQGKLR
jgi:hypothetical protein